MTLEQVKGNTWVLKSWMVIPLYKIDDRRCILLDTGLHGQQQQLEDTLDRNGLICAGILCSHAHIDHAGSVGYFQRKYGSQIAMSLGEAAVQATTLGLGLQHSCLSPNQVRQDPELSGTECVADVVIMPRDTQVTLCGVAFDVFHTPGHTVDHISCRTPDNVLYLGDAIMTGRELYGSKFPFALSIADYLDSLCLLRSIEADRYVAAHGGVFPEILSFVDMEIKFLTKRMQDILDLVEEKTTVIALTRKICEVYRIHPHRDSDLSYFERATRAYIFYLLDRGYLDFRIEDDTMYYCRPEQGEQKQTVSISIPKPGTFGILESSL